MRRWLLENVLCGWHGRHHSVQVGLIAWHVALLEEIFSDHEGRILVVSGWTAHPILDIIQAALEDAGVVLCLTAASLAVFVQFNHFISE